MLLNQNCFFALFVLFVFWTANGSAPVQPHSHSIAARGDSAAVVAGLKAGGRSGFKQLDATEEEEDDHDHDHDHEHHEDDHDHDHEESAGALIGHKVGALFVMLFVAGFGCGLPYLLRQTVAYKSIITYVNSFGCGAFLGLAFFHLLPEALYTADAAGLSFAAGSNTYSLVYILSYVGFVLILLCESILPGLLQPNGENLNKCAHVLEDLETSTKACHGVGIAHKQLEDGVEHWPTEKEQKTSSFSVATLLACLCLSVHSVFEGIVVGLGDHGSSVWIATISIVGHKWAVGFALAARCISKQISLRQSLWYLIIFIVASPIGVAIGLFISTQSLTAIAVVNSLSLGSIVYAACEFVFHEFRSSTNLLKETGKLTCLLLGSGLILGLMLVHLTSGVHEH